MRRRTTLLGVLLSGLAVAGCGATPPPTPAQGPSSPSSPTSTGARTTTPAAVPSQPPADGDAVEGTVVRFSGGGTSVDVTMGPDTPTTRDFVSLLPFTMQLEDLSGREKIGDPPRELDVQGTPGSDPEDGDLIYFTPWGNLGFYYDTSGVGYSDATPHLGTYQASEEELSALEGQQVSVEVVG